MTKGSSTENHTRVGTSCGGISQGFAAFAKPIGNIQAKNRMETNSRAANEPSKAAAMKM